MNEELEYVKKSGYRTRVLKALEDDTKMPKEISKDAEIRTNHVSNILRQLNEHNLVECVNPEYRKGRLYRLTDKGNKIVKKL